jgi:hypothetical protein
MYTDESGSEEFTLHSSVLVPVARWTSVLQKWLKYRSYLARKYSVPKSYHLHMHDWMGARDTPVPDDTRHAINTSKKLRHELACKALKTIASCDVLVFTTTLKTPVARKAYVHHVTELDRFLGEQDSWGVVVLDGPFANAREKLAPHREMDLASRRITEDPWVQPASGSQLVQMADIVAYAAFQAAQRNESKEFMWDWYPRLLHTLEPPDWCNCPQNETGPPAR